MHKLKSKVALVTGGASGLGKAIAQRLATDGATVVITDLQVPLGRATAKEGGFTFIQQDVTNEAEWPLIIRKIEKRFRRLDILVNNAGIIGPLDSINPETTRFADWKKVFAVNVDSVFLGCRAAIPALRRAGGGSIINISSIAGLSATPYGTAYGASKATVRQLTKSIAQHGAPDRIRCNSVHPGDVRTPLRDQAAEIIARQQGISVEAYYATEKARIPMGELARPEDIAAAVAFLASDDSRHMTGTKLIVDGGVIPCNTFRPKGKNP
jgi:3(or 17)beta-hydroxysteroid dehydrogenase